MSRSRDQAETIAADALAIRRREGALDTTTSNDELIESTWKIQTPHGEQDENGTDQSLIRANLRITPAQRLVQGDRARRNALDLLEYGRRARQKFTPTDR